MPGPKVCELGGGGLVLPLGGDWEQKWPQGVRIVLYMLGLFYCFAGVAIIADVFMAGIEKVTSKKLRLWDKEKKRFYTFELWNATVANLSLMALGSSAPEILLNVIDIFAKGFYLEGLGPGTIVGSASFNLEIIIAVCIISIPVGQIRYIKDMNVYIITAVCSIFAYLWMIVILSVISPNVVEVWEGILTFVFFPMLLVAAWAADKGYFSSSASEEKSHLHADMSPEEFLEMEAEIRKKHGEHLTAEQVLKVLEAMAVKPTSRAGYRIGATRAMFGGKRMKTMARSSLARKFSFIRGSKVVPFVSEAETQDEAPLCWFSWSGSKHAVFENAGKVRLQVNRGGNCTWPARVWYQTRDGTAKADEDYIAASGWVYFAENECQAFIEVEIVDDNAYEDNEDFFLTLSKPEILAMDGGKQIRAGLGEIVEAAVTIVDDDDAGMLCFESDHMTVNSPLTQDSEIRINVRRMGGGSGEVSVMYTFETDSAVKERDFDGKDGKLVFGHGQMEAFITATIKAVPRYDAVDKFRIVISGPQGGAKLNDQRDGGADKNILTVMIEAEQGSKDRVDKFKSSMQTTWSKSQVGHANWASQFKAAISVNGGDEDDEDCDPATKADYIAHYVTMPWKLLFAFVPPTDYCSGWVCFISALIMIGFVTMIIGDMASLLGCVMCWPDEITSITFVALGTSLPDTFASKTAAEQDAHADASVGNVTGSNCVNVFLGLGLPWMIAALHWSFVGKDAAWDAKYQQAEGLDWLGPKGSRKQGFVVMAGSLGFSVTVFSICAVVTVVMLALRRKFLGGELGGSAASRWASAGFLIFLWLLYIGLSSGQTIAEMGGLTCPNFAS